MGKKKRKQKGLAQPLQQQQPAQAHEEDASDAIAEELLVLEAIYAENFSMLQDQMGCKLRVLPSPGSADQENPCAVDLELRCAFATRLYKSSSAVQASRPVAAATLFCSVHGFGAWTAAHTHAALGHHVCLIHQVIWLSVRRFPVKYPQASVNALLSNARNVGESQLAQLHVELSQLAQHFAEQGETAGYVLYDLASAWLRDIEPDVDQVHGFLATVLISPQQMWWRCRGCDLSPQCSVASSH